MDAQYILRDGVPIIQLLCRDEKRRVMVDVVGFRPYLYVPIDADVPKRPDIVSVEEENRLTFGGEKVKKVFVRVPKDVRSVRTAFEHTFEADIMFGFRFMIDKGIKEGIMVEELKEVYNETEIEGY